MKITTTLISIPPYISTAWEHVASLYMEEQTLVFVLKDSKVIPIAGLSPATIEQIFAAHASFLESFSPQREIAIPKSGFEQLFQMPFRVQVGSVEAMGEALQHNPAYSGLPPMPDEIAKKIATLAKVISVEELLSMPSAEINCNCMYCQINRLLRQAVMKEKDFLPDHPALQLEEEPITESELQFEQWQVNTNQEKIYSVTNKLDPNERYTVHLGDPIGCTCGKSNCEHILAVLRS